jgi:serine/threonine protein kinase
MELRRRWMCTGRCLGVDDVASPFCPRRSRRVLAAKANRCEVVRYPYPAISRYCPQGVGVGRDLEPGDPARIGSYRLVGVLGSGGMGRVFLGRSPGGRPVAVKVIHGDLAADADFRIRFAREVATGAPVLGG